MTLFDDREHTFEKKFVHDAELMFRAMARRNMLTGLWAANLMGLSGDEASAYAITVVQADFEEAGDEDVVRKLVADLGSKASAETIRDKLKELLTVAKAQLMSDT